MEIDRIAKNIMEMYENLTKLQMIILKSSKILSHPCKIKSASLSQPIIPTKWNRLKIKYLKLKKKSSLSLGTFPKKKKISKILSLFIWNNPNKEENQRDWIRFNLKIKRIIELLKIELLKINLSLNNSKKKSRRKWRNFIKKLNLYMDYGIKRKNSQASSNCMLGWTR